LTVFNILGQQVRSLLDEHLQAGEHEVIWDGRSDAGVEVASGVYFYRLDAKGEHLTRKMALLR
jgi:hypothetical protein